MNPNRFPVWVHVCEVAHQRKPLSWSSVIAYPRNPGNVNPNLAEGAWQPRFIRYLPRAPCLCALYSRQARRTEARMDGSWIPQASPEVERRFEDRGLTDRERDAVRSALRGMTAAAVAEVMGVSASTV